MCPVENNNNGPDLCWQLTVRLQSVRTAEYIHQLSQTAAADPASVTAHTNIQTYAVFTLGSRGRWVDFCASLKI